MMQSGMFHVFVFHCQTFDLDKFASNLKFWIKGPRGNIVVWLGLSVLQRIESTRRGCEILPSLCLCLWKKICCAWRNRRSVSLQVSKEMLRWKWAQVSFWLAPKWARVSFWEAHRKEKWWACLSITCTRITFLSPALFTFPDKRRIFPTPLSFSPLDISKFRLRHETVEMRPCV